MSSARVFGYDLRSASKSLAAAIVFVVDDDVAVRESLDLLIRREGWKPETFASAQQFLNRPRPLVPSCLVLDLSIPGFHGLDLQKRIAVERPSTPIICITGQGDVSRTVQAMKAGALEFLTKPFDDDELLNGIQEALERSRVILAHEAEMQTLRDRYASLTRREREVLSLVAAGLLNKQVGGELGISEITVKAHRGQVMAKMKADSLADLVRMAARLGLPHPPSCSDHHRTHDLQNRPSCYWSERRRVRNRQISDEDVDTLRAFLEQEGKPVAIDLRDVFLVDREAVRLLALCEIRGIELRNGPAYIRGWTARGKAQMHTEGGGVRDRGG